MNKLIRIPLILIAVGLLLSIAGILLEKYADHLRTAPIPQSLAPSNLPPAPPNPEK